MNGFSRRRFLQGMTAACTVPLILDVKAAPGDELQPSTTSGQQVTHSNDNTISVLSMNAKADGVRKFDGAMVSGSAVLTSASGIFSSADIGKSIGVVGAGTSSGNCLSSSIAAYQNPHQVTLSSVATHTVDHCEYVYGTDNASAITAAGIAASKIKGRLYFPPGIYVSNGAILQPFVEYFGTGQSEICCTRNGLTPVRSDGITRDKYAYYNYTKVTSDLPAGATTIPLADAQSAKNIGIGLILVRSSASLAGATAQEPAPLAAEIVKVTAINGANLVLEQAVAYPITAPLIAKQNDFNAHPSSPDNWLERTSVHNLSVTNLADGSHLLNNGSYECDFHDLTLRGFTGIAHNGNCRTRWYRIKQRSTGRVLEVKTCSVLSTYENIEVTGPETPFTDTNINALDVGEAAKGIRFSKIKIHYENVTFPGSVMGPGGDSGSEDVVMEDIDIYAASAGVGLLHTMSSSKSDKNFSYRRINFHVPKINTLVRFQEIPGAHTTTSNVSVEDVVSEFSPTNSSITLAVPQDSLKQTVFKGIKASAPIIRSPGASASSVNFVNCDVSSKK